MKERSGTPLGLQTAVLFLVFNRPDTTRQVFEAIRQARPPRLYVAADGPRHNSVAEAGRVAEVRQVATEVDWPCEVKTLFRDNNLGCKNAVSEAITWFFDNEEQGIILEDDCLPSQQFFVFAEDMLNRYAKETRVMMISGTNYMSGKIKQPYFFSEHFTIWGWATWRRAWVHYDVEMRFWSDQRARSELSEKYSNKWIRKHFEYTFDELTDGYVDTWDIQWVFTGIINRFLCLTPSKNQIQNIGVVGTHGQVVTESHFLPIDGMDMKSYSDFSPKILQNFEYDHALHKLKSIPAVRLKMVKKILKKLAMYEIVKKFGKAIHGR
jgi:GR25 family glycosyltransferase involved in LPS biosynthesis